jgi:hypothetical protein
MSEGKAPERHIDRECGCKMFFSDELKETRLEWCAEHEALAAVLRPILDDFNLVLDDVAKREKASLEGH